MRGMVRCGFCNRPTIRLYARWRGMMWFDFDPVDTLPDGVEGWVPGRHEVRGRMVCDMAPVSQVSSGKAEAARRFMVLHRCEVRQRMEIEAGVAGDHRQLTHNA